MKFILPLMLAILTFSCQSAKRRELHTFHFPPGKTLPSLNDTNRFRAIMETMKANTNATLLINGNLHPVNQKLTDDRVWVVLNALDGAGIELGRIYIKEPNKFQYRSHTPNNQWFTVLLLTPTNKQGHTNK